MASTFENATPVVVGGNPDSVTMADVNGDGKLDLVVTQAITGAVSVALGNGDGTFQSSASFAAGSFPNAVSTADVNRDGRLDLLVANAGGISVLLGNGDGTFQTQISYAAGVHPEGMVVADVNGDGKTDLVVTNLNDSTVSVLLGNGDGTFQQQATYATGPGPASVITADVNRDGKPDLVVANLNDNTLSVLLGNGDGTFRPQVPYATGSAPFSVTSADVNGDGKTDLVVANSGDGTVSVLLGNGDGTFQPQATYATASTPASVTTADVDGDGKLDLVVADFQSNGVSFLRGNGDGTFQPQVFYATGTFPISVTSADVNHDGLPDLLVAAESAGDVDVLLGEASAVTSITASVSAGARLNSHSVITLVVHTAVPVTVSGHPELILSNSEVAVYSSTDGSGNLLFEYAVTGGDTSDLRVTGIAFNGGTFSTPLGQTSFATHQDLAVGSFPFSVTTADVNGDGKLDLVTANLGSNTVSVLLGNGNGTFQSQVTHATGSDPNSVIAADVNGDGKVDLVTANLVGNNVSVLLGGGDGTFQPKVNYATGSQPNVVIAADLNGDGKLDLVTANSGSGANSVSVLLGNGNGTFQTKADNVTGTTPLAIAAVDVNHDGKLDLVAANQGSNTVSVLLGNGDGTFQTQATYATGSKPVALATADLDGDGNVDLVVANSGSTSNNVSVLLGNSNGTFQDQATYAVGTSPQSVTIADVNHDGKLDLVVANASSSSNNVSVLLGIGNGTFQNQITEATGSGPESVTTADLDGDGKPDIVVANTNSNTVSTLLNTSTQTLHLDSASVAGTPGADTGIIVDTTPPAAPVITGFTPDSGVQNDGVTSATAVVLSGTAEPDATVKIEFAGQGHIVNVSTLLADDSGAWTFNTATSNEPILSEGTHTFTATATDAAGNTGPASAGFSVSVDTTPPAAPVITGFTPDSGVQNDGVTNATAVVLSGTAEANATVTVVFDGGNNAGATTADGSGAWTFNTNASSAPTLSEGTHAFTAIATDAAGNTGPASAGFSVTVDTTPPAPPTLALTHDTGFSSNDNITSDPSITYSAPASGDTLLYSLDGHSFTATVPVLATDHTADGPHTIAVEEQDAAGNISQAASLSFTLNTRGPGADISDMDGNTVNDLVFESHSTVDTLYASMPSGTLVDDIFPALTGVDATQIRAAGTGDVDGNGTADVVFQIGDDIVTKAAGNIATTFGPMVFAMPDGWTVSGVGDVNGDGAADILITDANNDAGKGDTFFIDVKASIAAGHTVASNLATPGADYVVRGVGDINGDGINDVVFQSTVDGDVIYADMRAVAQHVAANNFSLNDTLHQILSTSVINASLVVKAVGDPDRDGFADLVVEQESNPADGLVHSLVLEAQNGGNNSFSFATIAGLSDYSAFDVKGIADVNGDGNDDILMQYTQDLAFGGANLHGAVLVVDPAHGATPASLALVNQTLSLGDYVLV